MAEAVTNGRNDDAALTLPKRRLLQKQGAPPFMCCLSSASQRHAARLRGVLRVLREWVLVPLPQARSCVPVSCRDAGFLHDGGRQVPGCVCSVMLSAAVRVRVHCERASARPARASPNAHYLLW